MFREWEKETYKDRERESVKDRESPRQMKIKRQIDKRERGIEREIERETDEKREIERETDEKKEIELNRKKKRERETDRNIQGVGERENISKKHMKTETIFDGQ